MTRTLRVLALEDEGGDAEVLLRHLESTPDARIEFIHCASADEADAHLEERPVDLVFLDHRPGSIDGCAFLRRLRSKRRLEPVIVVTGCEDPYVASELTRAGADAYIIKKDVGPESLRSCIGQAEAEAEARKDSLRLAEHQGKAAEQLAELNQQLARTGRQDALTGLLNRGAWEECLALESERSQRYGHPCAVVLLDLDYFKLLNDSQGHRAGDEVLRRIAQCVRATCRKTDMVGRYGGEELIVFLPETELDQATALAERIRKAIFELNLPHEKSHVANRITASLGVASTSGGTAEDVVRRADAALYAAKGAGRNRVRADRAPPPAADVHTTDKRRIVVVDDDDADVELLRRHLEQVPRMCFELVHVHDLDGARDEVVSATTDVVFLDYLLGSQSGLEVLKDLRAGAFAGPIICLTGQGDEKIAAELMRHGADDYLVKADINPDVLRRALENASTQHRRREVESDNRRLLTEVRLKNDELAAKNRRLAELYITAHEFVDNVSHEFRTPLTVIKEFTSIIADGLAGPTTNDQREYLGTVLNRVDDLAIMIDDMLDISKLESGLLSIARRKVSVADVVERVRTTLERKAATGGIVLHIDPMDELPDLYCDAEKIGRVLINLCVNAIKFSPEGGPVHIWGRFEAHDAAVRLGVTDSGRGIEPENLAIIFERFRQVEGSLRSSTKGFGLGLSIVKELVHLNLGDVEVESEPGKGSTFSFTIPIGEPSSLIGRYLRRLPALREGSSLVTLVEARLEENAESERAEEIGEFLQHQLRRSDLIFPAGAGAWILAIASSREETRNMTDRISAALAKLNRNRPATLGGLKLCIGDEWDLCADRDATVAHFLESVHRTEPVHA